MHSAKKVIIKPMGQELATPTSSTLYKLIKKSMAVFSHFRINTLMHIASVNQPLEELEARCVAVTMPKE